MLKRSEFLLLEDSGGSPFYDSLKAWNNRKQTLYTAESVGLSSVRLLINRSIPATGPNDVEYLSIVLDRGVFYKGGTWRTC